MDEAIEQPVAQIPGTGGASHDGEDSGDEETYLDWSKVPVIPKRGEKDFEPVIGRTSGLQVFTLEKSRNAMFGALQGIRASSSKSISYALWFPSLARAEVVMARGTHFSTMGYSAAFPGRKHKHQELIPEEALYLLERGSLFCWRTDVVPQSKEAAERECASGTPMSVQQAFAEMIGRDNLSSEKYQAYAYLKRLGFTVIRAHAPSSSLSYPVLQPQSPVATSLSNRLRNLTTGFVSRISNLINYLFRRLDWWNVSHSLYSYPAAFATLRFLPSGRPLSCPPSKAVSTPSPYQVFYHVWKPSTHWRRTPLTPPDFEVIVVDAETTPLPTLQEISDVFDTLPLSAPPRAKRPKTAPTKQPPTFFGRLMWWKSPVTAEEHPPSRQSQNIYAALKAGRKSVIIAVVDNGAISFMRFGEGCFEDWPLM